MTDHLITRIVLLGITAIICMLIGAKGENQRILTKCLEHNQTLPYAQAIEQCKEMVK